ANEGGAFGEPAKRYALQIALEQIKGCKSELTYSNEHMERGHEQEPIARMLYEERYFIDVDNGGFFDHDTYGDSPDGLVGTDGLLEIKSVVASTHYATMVRGKFDPAYKWQLIGHLDCSGRDWVDFVSYCSDFPAEKQLIVYRLNATDFPGEIARLRERRDAFIALVSDVKRKILESA
ncbi:YqaJ viral recombinase family protein, partial [Salmonella enterica]|nr:YqaJ viral recombinase family protein [Salmonella enterica]